MTYEYKVRFSNPDTNSHLANCTRLGTMHLMSKRKRADTTRIVVLLEALLLPRPRRRRGRQRQLYSYSTKDLSPSHVRLYDTYI